MLGGLIGTRAPLDEVTPVIVSVTGFAVLLKNMNPISLNTNAAAGVSGFENVTWLIPGPLTQTPEPGMFEAEAVLPNDTLPLRPMRCSWIEYTLPSFRTPGMTGSEPVDSFATAVPVGLRRL